MVALYAYFSYDLPKISSLKDYRPPIVTEVYSSQGEVIGEFFTEKRHIVKLSGISPVFIQAIIAAEDDEFFEHKGINLWSIIRAAFKNIRSFEMRQGGSTITQQIVKSLLLTPEKKFSRKIKEAILAIRIERYLSKDDILTLYLNQTYFGRGAYGVEAAARIYFGKSALGLTLSEASYLAGLPKAPSSFRNISRALERRSYVLSRMIELGHIRPQEKEEAEKTPLNFAAPANINTVKAPYFVEHIRKEVEQKYGFDRLYNEGLRIETTLDVNMQKAAEEAVMRGIEAYEKRSGKNDSKSRVQAALVCMYPFSGHVKALVGGRNYHESQFNRAIQAQRQPGSAFKPIIYAAAIDKGYTPATVIIDSPLVFEINGKFWEPQNYDRSFSGPTTLRKALTFSRNVVTVKVLKDIGIDYVINYAKNLGINGEFTHDLALSLGTCGVSLLNMVKAYTSFCTLGVNAEPIFITRILDRDGNIVEDNHPQLTAVLSPQTAFIMTSMLQSVVEEGTGKKVRALNRPCAGKTGTTNDVRDAWFIGFTPRLVSGVWLGFDDLSPLGKHETGAVAASPVWLDFMQAASKGESIQTFKVPDGIVFVRINPATGSLSATKQEDALFECFNESTLPAQYSQNIIKKTGQESFEEERPAEENVQY